MRILIVSNRLPVTISKEAGVLKFHESSGGLVSGLSAYLESLKESDFTQIECLWIGWPGMTIGKKHEAEVGAELAQNHMIPIFLSEKEMDKFYHGFCNKSIWPIFHYFPTYAVYEEKFWESYKHVNNMFCETILDIVQPDDIVWIHDYHLMLLPQYIRAHRPNVSIGFFLHIPFPSIEIFRLLPETWRRELLEGLLGADLIGFHTYDYVQYFLNCVLRILGYENKMGEIYSSGRLVKVDTFPMGIDFKQFDSAANDPGVKKERKKLIEKFPRMKFIVSIDRLDYTKGIINRLNSYERFLKNNPDWHQKVVFILMLIPSRIKVEHYQQMKKQIDELVGKINGRFSTMAWIPIHYQYRFIPFESLVALYSCSDVALITPLRDGMNLVSKEFLASHNDNRGVLILSEMTGAAKELGEALIINPNNILEIENVIKEALEMPEEEQIRRNKKMRHRLQRYDVVSWADDFLQELSNIKNKQAELHTRYLSARLTNELVEAFKKARFKLLFLDYDGTLVPFFNNPAETLPPPHLLHCLNDLTKDPTIKVVIVSGRDKGTLTTWFGPCPAIDLVAEHGVWLRQETREWRLLKRMNKSWKQQLVPLLERYTVRLPGSFIEEKDYSLVWHFRASEPELGAIRAQELMDNLLTFTANLDLQVLPGNKVIEVRSFGVNKGNAALRWIDKYQPDFIMAIGDDVTDEDLFNAMPKNSYSIKVGINLSQADYFIYNTDETLALLQELASCKSL